MYHHIIILYHHMSMYHHIILYHHMSMYHHIIILNQRLKISVEKITSEVFDVKADWWLFTRLMGKVI